MYTAVIPEASSVASMVSVLPESETDSFGAVVSVAAKAAIGKASRAIRTPARIKAVSLLLLDIVFVT
jgi:hypothetical protein